MLNECFDLVRSQTDEGLWEIHRLVMLFAIGLNPQESEWESVSFRVFLNKRALFAVSDAAQRPRNLTLARITRHPLAVNHIGVRCHLAGCAG